MDCGKWVFAASVMACAGVLAGCAGTAVLRAEHADGKSLLALPDKAQIFVYRNESLGFAIPMTVAIDGRAIGRTGSQTYVMRDVEPGVHEITSYAEDVSAITIDVEAGKPYYVWQEVKLGFWKARSLLHAVDEDTGRSAIDECKPIAPAAAVSAVAPQLSATQ